MTEEDAKLPLPDAGRPAESSETPRRGLLSVLLLGPRAWKRWWIALVRSVTHEEILTQTAEQAGFTSNYAFMVAIASGIATIGLLLNSPAVIIGAMLISPLMGPIVGAGFALAVFDVDLGKRGARALILGAVTAIVFAAAIVALSPIQDVTPEILARTRPNLFDLAVAILSGTAGGYGTIRGRGGAIVGVAIATALMPPLAVVGFGLATLQWSIVRGALLLFVTNLAAIALAVAAVAEWYGFGRGGLRKRFARRAVISLLVLAPLAVPLFISLRSIAWESRANAAVREILETEAHRLDQGQLAQFHVHIGYGAPAVEAIVVSAKPESGLEARMTDELRQALGTPVTLHLTQLQANDPARVSAALELAPAKTPVKPPLREQMEATVRSELPYALTAVDVDMEQHRIVVVPKGDDHVDLAGWRDIESRLAARHADQQVTLVPPAGALPAIAFARGKNSLDDAATKRLELVLWTLECWNAKQVELVGHAGTRADGALAMARKRAAAVGRWFGDHGIVATQSAVYPLPRQSALERERGDAAFRSVDIGLPAQRTER